MSIVEFDGLQSWSLDASETKSPLVGMVGMKGQENRETVTASPCLVFAALVAQCSNSNT